MGWRGQLQRPPRVGFHCWTLLSCFFVIVTITCMSHTLPFVCRDGARLYWRKGRGGRDATSHGYPRGFRAMALLILTL